MAEQTPDSIITTQRNGQTMVQLHQEEAATRTRKLKVQNADPLHFALSHFHDNLRQ